MKYYNLVKDLYLRDQEERRYTVDDFDCTYKDNVISGIKISNITDRNRVYYLNNSILYNYHINTSDEIHYFIWI